MSIPRGPVRQKHFATVWQLVRHLSARGRCAARAAHRQRHQSGKCCQFVSVVAREIAYTMQYTKIGIWCSENYVANAVLAILRAHFPANLDIYYYCYIFRHSLAPQNKK